MKVWHHLIVAAVPAACKSYHRHALARSLKTKVKTVLFLTWEFVPIQVEIILTIFLWNSARRKMLHTWHEVFPLWLVRLVMVLLEHIPFPSPIFAIFCSRIRSYLSQIEFGTYSLFSRLTLRLGEKISLWFPKRSQLAQNSLPTGWFSESFSDVYS